MPEITKYFPAQAQAIRRKIGQEQSAMLGNLIGAEDFQNEIEDKSPDEISQIIEKKPPAERDNLYYKAAETAFTSGKFEEAKKYHEKIKTKRDYDYLDKWIESAMPLALAEKGDMREVRRMLAKVKTAEERIEILTALAASVAKKGDKKSASALAGEARSMYSGRMKNRKNLASILQIAQAYAVFDAEQGFAFLENNMSFFNDVIAAGILLDEFNENGSVENEEVRLDTVRGESYRNLSKGVALIKSLSAADFDRTISLAERFSRAEVRFYARFRIAEALLNPEAEVDEKEFQSNLEGEHGEH
jgi:tetratricopeptide (TPR) repeat protein